MDHLMMFMATLTVIAVAGIVAGCILAVKGYSSAGPFSIAAACVGVLGTLAAQEVFVIIKAHEHEHEA